MCLGEEEVRGACGEEEVFGGEMVSYYYSTLLLPFTPLFPFSLYSPFLSLLSLLSLSP